MLHALKEFSVISAHGCILSVAIHEIFRCVIIIVAELFRPLRAWCSFTSTDNEQRF